jgi:sugar phosphate isomerase/epimerase
MIISIVTDELSGDPETAFELGLEWGVRHFELRGAYGERVPRLSAHARHRLVRAVREFGVEITALSPGLFKFRFPEREPARSNLGWMDAGFFDAWRERKAMLADHLERLLPETLELAAEVGARTLISFSFSRDGGPGGEAPQGVVETLAEAAERAAAAGIDFLIETEEGHWADTGARSAALIGRIGTERAGINWDPANALIDGDVPYPDGYRFVRPFVRNVHFKDARRFADGSWTLLADGDVDWSGQVRALVGDGYAGPIAIEPHLSPAVASTRNALEKLRRLIREAGGANTAR